MNGESGSEAAVLTESAPVSQETSSEELDAVEEAVVEAEEETLTATEIFAQAVNGLTAALAAKRSAEAQREQTVRQVKDAGKAVEIAQQGVNDAVAADSLAVTDIDATKQSGRSAARSVQDAVQQISDSEFG